LLHWKLSCTVTNFLNYFPTKGLQTAESSNTSNFLTALKIINLVSVLTCHHHVVLLNMSVVFYCWRFILSCRDVFGTKMALIENYVTCIRSPVFVPSRMIHCQGFLFLIMMLSRCYFHHPTKANMFWMGFVIGPFHTTQIYLPISNVVYKGVEVTAI